MSTKTRTPSRRKHETHKRIVEAAARAIRRSGYAGTGVADIMKDVGLTHGGFYAHFASRDAMLAEAADPILSKNCGCTAASRMRERVADGRVARARAASATTP